MQPQTPTYLLVSTRSCTILSFQMRPGPHGIRLQILELITTLQLNPPPLCLGLLRSKHSYAREVKESLVERARGIGNEVITLSPTPREHISRPLPAQINVDNKLLRFKGSGKVATRSKELGEWLLGPGIRIGLASAQIRGKAVAREEPNGHALRGPFVDVNSTTLLVESWAGGCHRLAIDGVVGRSLDGAARCPRFGRRAGVAVCLAQGTEIRTGISFDGAARAGV